MTWRICYLCFPDILNMTDYPLFLRCLQGVFVYWCTNNVLSLAQGQILKTKAIASYLDIPKAPAAAPAFRMTTNPITKFIDVRPSHNGVVVIPLTECVVMGAAQAIRHPERRVEIIDGSSADSKAKQAIPLVTPTAPPPQTFTAPPKKKVKKK